MKLYAWQPQGHGEQSFFVMAESEEQARQAVEAKIAELLAKGASDDYWEEDGHYTEYDFNGFGTGYYVLTVLDAGEVALNDND